MHIANHCKWPHHDCVIAELKLIEFRDKGSHNYGMGGDLFGLKIASLFAYIGIVRCHACRGGSTCTREKIL